MVTSGEEHLRLDWSLGERRVRDNREGGAQEGGALGAL